MKPFLQIRINSTKQVLPLRLRASAVKKKGRLAAAFVIIE
jgi:hypothetical protein